MYGDKPDQLVGRNSMPLATKIFIKNFNANFWKFTRKPNTPNNEYV